MPTLFRFIFPIFFLMPMLCHASLFPFISSATAPTWPGSVRTQAQLTWQSINVPENNAVIPCENAQDCMYGLIIHHSERDNPSRTNHYPWDYLGSGKTMVTVTPGMTWSQAASKFIAEYGASGRRIWDWPWRPAYWEICLGTSTRFTKPGRPVIPSPSACQIIPPMPISCRLDGNADINHGVLMQKSVNGHKASSQLKMVCSGPAKVAVRIVPEQVDIGGDITAVLSVNGQKTGGIINVPDEALITFESQLKGEQARGGIHEGHSVVFFDLQ